MDHALFVIRKSKKSSFCEFLDLFVMVLSNYLFMQLLSLPSELFDVGEPL